MEASVFLRVPSTLERPRRTPVPSANERHTIRQPTNQLVDIAVAVAEVLSMPVSTWNQATKAVYVVTVLLLLWYLTRFHLCSKTSSDGSLSSWDGLDGDMMDEEVDARGGVCAAAADDAPGDAAPRALAWPFLVLGLPRRHSIGGVVADERCNESKAHEMGCQA